MREHRRQQSETPWRVPVAVADVAETGEHMDLVADAETRAGIARVAGLGDLPRLEASFDLLPHSGGGLRVTGRVSATVGQTCVVTLEPLTNEVEEEIDLLYMPPAASAAALAVDDEPEPETEPKWGEPEPLIGGSVDLGGLATEFLILGLDPYPRKPGAVFEPPHDKPAEAGPFAGLAGLMKNRNGS
jgi:hypothetical protein